MFPSMIMLGTTLAVPEIYGLGERVRVTGW